MVRSKAPSKKQKRGVDFSKIKRKIGRKLPPPKNATDTTVKSKAIILPEQSVASDRLGLATSRKGLTLKELLQQSSHHNPKIRRDALNGIKDLVLKHPSELRLHRLAIIEKLRERISDDDKLVRETLYLLLQSVIFPSFKEEIPGPVISLIMAYVFNAMTHLTVDIRLMAFKFFDLIVQHYPSSFFLYAEKVLQNYEDILRNNQIYFKDKSNLKVALVGLARCLSLLAYDKRNIEHSHEQATVLHAFEPDLHKEHSGDSLILKKLEDLMPTLVNCFHEFLPSARAMPVVETHLFDCMLHTLESINLAVRIYVAGAYKPTTFGVSFPSLTGRNEGVMKLGSMPLLLKRLFDIFPINPIHYSTGKEDYRYFALNVTLTEIFLHLHDWAGAPVALMEKFLGFITNILSEQIFGSRRPNKVSLEKNLTSLLAFIPKVVLKVDNNWKSRLLEGFTRAFQGCKPESKLTLACLSAMEEMLFSTRRQDPCLLEARSAEFLEFQVTWVKALTVLLLRLGDKYPSTSKVILHIQHRLGKSAPMGSPIAKEYDSMQYSLKEFYSTYSDDGSTNYGPFIKLPRDCQELAICCLYYFSSLDQRLLESLACCSLWQMLMDDHPTLFWTPCAAHCIDLMLHDICKLPIITTTVKRAIALNGYIYNHPYVLNMMRTFTEQKELIRPGVTRFATVFLTLQSIYNQKNKLRRMFTSEEWSTSRYHRDTKGKNAYETVMSVGFWNNILYSLRATRPLVRVLRLVDSEKKPAKGYIYEAMDRAKEAISKSFNYNEAKYYEIWEIIDKRWNDQLHRPLHAAGYYLNPEYFYSTPRIESNEELNEGFLNTMARLVPDEAIQHLVETELSLYRYARGVMGSANAIRNRALWSPGHDLDSYVLSRIVEILNSAYKAGRVQITDHINFLVTLLAKFKVIPERFLFGGESVPNISNRGNFKAITDAVCSSISQIGDGSLVLKILQKTIFNQMSLKLPLDNMRALLRVVVILSPIQAGLPEETLSTLSYFLFEYFVDAASYLSENYDESANTDRIRIFQYYTQPAIFLFHRNTKLLGFALDLLGSSITEPCSSLVSGGGARSVSEQLSRIHTVAAIIGFIYKDVNLQQSLSSCRAAMKEMLQNIHIFQASNHSNMPLEERHKLQCTYDQLKTQTGKLHCWDASDFQTVSDER